MSAPASPCVTALQKMEIFAGVRPETLDRLLSLSTAKEVPCGDFFVQEGESAESLFALEWGEAAVLKTWQGKQYILDHLQAGACFGEIALLDLSPRTASVIAVGPSRAIEISTQSLFGLYQADVEQFALIQMNIARTVCRRFRQASERLFDARIKATKLRKAA
jgi:CRP/FNR family transcriptional regulator, cyclic AMP receptor protein